MAKMRINPRKYIKGQLVLSLVLAVILAIVGYATWKVFNNVDEIDQTDNENVSQPVIVDQSTQQQLEQTKKFDADKLSLAISGWASGQTGSASVVLADHDGVILATLNPDQKYFAASIYKLFVAYEGYRQVDSGEVKPSEMYLNGHTRAECLDLMIRESDSPCAEKLWSEIGKEKLTEILISYGINDTSMTAITTTASDVTKILSRIESGVGLSANSRNAILESMKNQVYRDSLNKGLSSDVLVYNKIGFNEQVEYHDVGIVEFKDGRRMVITVLTENVGADQIAELGRQIEEAANYN